MKIFIITASSVIGAVIVIIGALFIFSHAIYKRSVMATLAEPYLKKLQEKSLTS